MGWLKDDNPGDKLKHREEIHGITRLVYTISTAQHNSIRESSLLNRNFTKCKL